MGMCGQYIAIDKVTLKSIQNEEINIYDIATDENNCLDIDKAWDALHFMFSSVKDTVVPLEFNYLVEGYTDCYVYCLWADDVADASEYLEGLEENTIKSMFNFQEMCDEDVYPITNGENEEEFFEYIYSNLLGIKAFFKRVAEEGKFIIFYVS